MSRQQSAAAAIEADEAFVADVRRAQRHRPWALHELRDMGHLSRELVQTGEKFGELHLRLEPQTRSAILGDSVRGSTKDGAHMALLKRSKLAARVDDLYAEVAKKLTRAQLAVFAMMFAPDRPSLADLKAVSGWDFGSVQRLIETGLTKLWAVEDQLTRAS